MLIFLVYFLFIVADFNIRINFVKVREYSHGYLHTIINVRDYK